MISSGMIPSGEKNQEDLSRTQYGTVPSPNALADVYKKMYEKKEETLNEHHQKDKDGNTIPHEDEELKEGAGLYANIHAKRKRGGKMRKKGAKGAPSSQDFANAAKTAKEEVEINEAPFLAALAPLLGKGAAGAAAGKAAAAGATKAAVTTTGGKVVSGGAAKLSTMQKVGKTVKSVAKNPVVQSQAISMSAGQPKGKTNKTSTISAGADLFDIVKGQLLDEGLSEEEIRDIMLTLTPDEIMEELSDIVKRNDAINKANAMKAAQKNQVPQEVRDASKRQYTAGGPKDKGENKYTTQDKKTIIDYNKDKGSM